MTRSQVRLIQPSSLQFITVDRQESGARRVFRSLTGPFRRTKDVAVIHFFFVTDPRGRDI